MLAALHLLVERESHVVAQVVEAVFIVCAVGDVGGVGGLLLLLALAGDDHADGEAQKAVEPPHPLGVATREVVVDGDDVHALAFKCVQIHRECRGERLALARAHLGDLALVEHRAADQLHVEVAHAHHPLAGLAADREGIRPQGGQRLALREAVAQNLRLCRELGIAQRGVFRFEGGDVLDDLLLETADQTLVAAPENPGEQVVHHR